MAGVENLNRLLRIFAVVFIVCGAVTAQTSNDARKEVETRVNALLNIHIGIENQIPNGWSYAIMPVSMNRADGDTVVASVHILFRGVPPGTLFEEQVLPVGEDKPVSSLGGISVGKDGTLICGGRSPEQCRNAAKPDDPIEFTLQALKGEPHRLLFVSPAGTIGMVIVPNPVSNTNRGCTLSAVRLTPEFDLALITGTGYPPNTDIHYVAKPGRNVEQIIQSDGRGVFRFAQIPTAKPDQKSGTLQLKINVPTCSPEVKYDWGSN
jgi:hypothetical protein